MMGCVKIFTVFLTTWIMIHISIMIDGSWFHLLHIKWLYRKVRFTLHKSFLVFFLITYAWYEWMLMYVKKTDVIDDYQCMCANSEDTTVHFKYKKRKKNFVQPSGLVCCCCLIKFFYSFLIYPNNLFTHKNEHSTWNKIFLLHPFYAEKISWQ